MNKDLLETNWVQVREVIREKFGNLSEEDIRQINGRYDQLVAKLQQKYGYTREEAEERIRSWNFDRFATTPKRQFIRDENVSRDTNRVTNFERDTTSDSSLYKWLLGLGIPLLLLGTYFLTTRNPEMSPVITHEQVIQETPADRSVSAAVRNTLLSQQDLSLTQNVQITTRDGVVTLTGTVPNASTRDFVVNAAQNSAGVRQVINHLEIR